MLALTMSFLVLLEEREVETEGTCSGNFAVSRKLEGVRGCRSRYQAPLINIIYRYIFHGFIFFMVFIPLILVIFV